MHFVDFDTFTFPIRMKRVVLAHRIIRTGPHFNTGAAWQIHGWHVNASRLENQHEEEEEEEEEKQKQKLGRRRKTITQPIKTHR